MMARVCFMVESGEPGEGKEEDGCFPNLFLFAVLHVHVVPPEPPEPSTFGSPPG